MDWKQANTDINQYKAYTKYVVILFKKVKTSAHQEAAKEVFENNLHHYEKMKTISRASLSKYECSVQEAVYH